MKHMAFFASIFSVAVSSWAMADNFSAEEAALSAFSASDVAVHNQKSDCWFIIDNNVYNVTDFISQHPGGEFIAKFCGKDATAAFRGQHDNSQDAVLAKFLIGSLAQ